MKTQTNIFLTEFFTREILKCGTKFSFANPLPENWWRKGVTLFSGTNLQAPAEKTHGRQTEAVKLFFTSNIYKVSCLYYYIIISVIYLSLIFCVLLPFSVMLQFSLFKIMHYLNFYSSFKMLSREMR